MDDLKYVYHGRRSWVMEPTGNEHIGWNTRFEACAVLKKTPKRIIVLSPTFGKLSLNRHLLEIMGQTYHSRFGEYFYSIKPEVDPEKQTEGWAEFIGRMRGTPDVFIVFGLSPNCSKADVKRAYKRLARSKHPDTGGSHKAFIELNEAYERAMAVAR